MPVVLPDLPRLKAVRWGESVHVDAFDPARWQAVEAVELRDTVSGAAPLQATRVKAAWDQLRWYLHFDVEDTRAWATYTSRENRLWDEEVIEFFFDPVGDLEGYFEFQINPLGTVKELVLRRSSSGWRKDFTWMAEGLQSRVVRTDKGWMAVVSVPFAALGDAVPTVGSVWRANFLRIDRPNGPGSAAELSAWSPTGLRQFHRAARFGFVEFDA